MKLPRHNGRGASGIDERLSTLKLSRAVLVENSGKKGKARIVARRVRLAMGREAVVDAEDFAGWLGPCWLP